MQDYRSNIEDNDNSASVRSMQMGFNNDLLGSGQLSMSPLTCHICSYQCCNISTLNNHIQSHEADKVMHNCGECEKQFSSINDLRRHLILMHPNKTAYKCQFCKARYAEKASFERHKLTHSEKLLLCGKCSFKCFKFSTLQNHIRKHNDSNYFSCKICGRLFSKKRILLKHLASHNFKSNLECPICPHTSNANAELQDHIRAHHFTDN